MFTDPVIAGTILLSLIALGEVVSTITKSRVSMFLVAIFGYVILVWLGIMPKSLINDSNWVEVGLLLGAAPIIVHMGTLIPIDKIREQWKTVGIALFGIVFGAGTVLVVISIFADYQLAVAGAGPLTGGVVAFLVTSQGLSEAGLNTLIIIPALILSFQTLVGMPLGSYFLGKYVKQNHNSFKDINAKAENYDENLLLPKKYQSDLILLFIVFVAASLSLIFENYMAIPYSLTALLLGVLGKKFKVFPEAVLIKANAYSVSMIGLIFSITVTLNDVKFSDFLNYILVILAILFIGVIGIVIGGYIASIIFKRDRNLSISIALTAIIAFPGDYILSKEVSKSFSKDEEEEEKIFDNILTPMLIGGFTTVTVGSVVISSILINTL